MKTRIWVVLLFVILLAACQSGANPTPMTTESATAYPAPAQQVITTEAVEVEVYPPPPQFVLYNPYPDPNDGDVIEWRHAEYLILSGGVKKVAQFQSLEVTLTLKDDRTVSTKEPEIDDVFQVIERCGAQCKDITQVTE